jgi:hypothetical protein
MRMIQLGILLVLTVAVAAQDLPVVQIDEGQFVTHQHLVSISLTGWRSTEEGGPWSKTYQLSKDGELYCILLEHGQEPQRLAIDQAGFLDLRSFVLEQLNSADLGDNLMRSDPRGVSASIGLFFDGLNLIKNYDGATLEDIPSGLLKQVEYLDSLERRAL